MRIFDPGTALRIAFSIRSCRRYFAARDPLGLLKSGPSAGAQAMAGAATSATAVRAEASAAVNLLSIVAPPGQSALQQASDPGHAIRSPSHGPIPGATWAAAQRPEGVV